MCGTRTAGAERSFAATSINGWRGAGRGLPANGLLLTEGEIHSSHPHCGFRPIADLRHFRKCCAAACVRRITPSTAHPKTHVGQEFQDMTKTNYVRRT